MGGAGIIRVFMGQDTLAAERVDEGGSAYTTSSEPTTSQQGQCLCFA